MLTHKPLVIDTTNLSKSYGKVTALSSLNLKVPRNSIFGFLGPNGAGKTTTMKLLLGLAKPSSGVGKIFGLDIVKNSIQIRQRIGYLSQHPRFPKQKTASEILKFSLSFFSQESKAGAQQKIDSMLNVVGLFDKANRSVGNLSGGELQRLGLAQAQINNPELLILDEPAASLDPIGRNDVLEVMKRLSAKTTIFYSTHILDDVQRVSDTVAILNKGKLVTQGPIENLLTGNEETTYEVLLTGNTDPAQLQVSKQSWINEVKIKNVNENTLWIVSVNDEKQAEKHLLRIILSNKDVNVLEFCKKKYELEEVFMELVKGEQ